MMTEAEIRNMANIVVEMNNGFIQYSKEKGLPCPTPITLEDVRNGINMANQYELGAILAGINYKSKSFIGEEACDAFVQWVNDNVYTKIHNARMDKLIDEGYVELVTMTDHGTFLAKLTPKGKKKKIKL
jgi:hypothetical protein